MLEVISHLLSGVAIAVALFMLLVPNRSLGKKVAAVSVSCAAIGIFFPAVGICLWVVVIVGLSIAFVVAVVRGLKHFRF